MGNMQTKPCFSDEVNLSHFRLLRVVGRGAFGKVRIVERKDTGLTFALKYIRKEDIIRSESVRNILRERRMLEQLNYQFICNLRYSFQDIEYMYLVVDLMNGGDLRFHISRKTFTEEAIRFWIAELGLALRYIHSQGIIHRDVKPDNVLLDAEGHIHLADFNVASDFTPGKPLMSKSGTLAYLAPEVFKGKGYTCAADWWSLGVVFYECIYNKRPFEKHKNVSLQAEILKAKPKFPVTDPPVSIVCMHAISSALEEDPAKRMGSKLNEEFSSFTDNPFFRSIDFEALERKEIEPVFVPSSEKTNFDATYDLEELLLEEAPLEARARRQKPREQLREDASEKEIREDEMYKMIEEHFTPFDYTAAAYQRYVGAIGANIDKKKSNVPEKNENCDLNSNPHKFLSRNASAPDTRPSILSSPSQTVQSPSTNHLQHSAGSNPQTVKRQSSIGLVTAPISQKDPPRRSDGMNHSMQIGIRENETWTQLAKHDSTLPADAKIEAATRSTGIFSFLGRKKGRGHCPKSFERGILGKEGARVVISSG